MILPQTYAAALCLMILSMLCWGSWANTYKASKWRFELYYFDFAVGLLAVSFLIAITAGSMGFDGFTFFDDMFHAGKRQWFYGFVAGVVFNLANMLLMAAIAVAGMAVAFPVGIGLALIIGVVSNYLIKPAGNPTFIFGGCALIIAAIIVCAMAYQFISNIRHEEEAKAGKAKSTRRPGVLKGVIIALVSGVLMGSFYPLIEKGKQGDLGLGPYAIAVLFAIGVFLSTFVFNLFFMNLPVQGEPLEFVDYFKGPLRGHVLGFLGGGIWILGAVASFAVASAEAVHVGPAVSYAMGQGSTLISALWGILLWKEFRGADAKTKALLALMLILFALGLTLVSMAPLSMPQLS
jgi:glucose uptake protein